MSAFETFRPKAWPYLFRVRMIARDLHGGIPSDPKVTEGWLKTKLAAKDDLLRQMVAEVMVERGITAEEAIEEAAMLKSLCGFKRDEDGILYIEGRQMKAAIKEAASVAGAVGKLPTGKAWGKTSMGLKGFIAEHIFVVEDRISLGVSEPDEVAQAFVHTHRGAAIRYNEVVAKADLQFHVMTDWAFTEEQWAMLWLTGERQGIGAVRSQGAGIYEVMEWEAVKQSRRKK